MGLRAAAVRLRIDARRPASWMALGSAVAAGCWLAGEPSARWPARALLAGAMSSAAAIGALPRVRPGDGPAWAGLRAAWPAVGAVIAWLVGGADPATFGPTVGMLAACVGMAVACVVVTVRRDGWFEGPGWYGRRGIAVPGAAMMSALAGMAFFLLAAPHLDAGYLAIAGAWIVLEALPRATLGPGPNGDAARRLLMATTPRAPRAAWEGSRILAAHAAVFAWPPLVVAVVAGSAGTAVRPLAIAAAIGLGSLALAATSAVATIAGASRETTWAVALATALAGFALGDAASPWPGLEPARPPGLMLSNPGDPARLPEPRAEPRLRPHPRGVASCPDSPSPARLRRPGWERRSSFC